MVYSELSLKTVHGHLAFSGDDTSIVDEDMECGVLSFEILCQPADCGLGGKVGQEQENTFVTAFLSNFSQGYLTPLLAAAYHNNSGSNIRQTQGGGLADAGVSSRNHAGFASH
jgi:hypothetical protein